jgi:N6-adenosine-specific RNA methylase IME4
MTTLAQYERAIAALAEVTDIGEVLSLRDELDHIRLHAQKIRDLELMAKALVFQLRIERRLGILMEAARQAGQLNERGRPKRDPETLGDAAPPATLKELGVDKYLSAKAQRAAELDDGAFEGLVASVRERMASRRAIIIDPIEHDAKAAQVQKRRDDHAARTMNGGTAADLRALAASGFKAGTLYMDPPWHLETWSSAGQGRSANTHYTTSAIEHIVNDLAPLREIAADDCVLLMWMVDWCPGAALDLIAALGFTHKTTAFTWAKTNAGIDLQERRLDVADDRVWHLGQGYWSRANPEDCWLATRGSPKRLYADVRQLIIAPVAEHSRKPDETYERIERLVEGPYLELYARRPRQGWISWGNELEFSGVAA